MLGALLCITPSPTRVQAQYAQSVALPRAALARLIGLLHFIHHFAAKVRRRRGHFASAFVAASVLETVMSVLGRAKRCAVAALVLGAAVMACLPARAETITVALDQASVVKLPAQVATIIIGNPLIADASLQRGGILVVTGKGYGSTNLVALDRNGSVLMDKTVQVLGTAGKELVTVYRGVDRESYSCAPDCAARATLGDSLAYFNSVLAASAARNAAATTSPGR